MSALMRQSRRFKSSRSYSYSELRNDSAPQKQIKLVPGAKLSAGDRARRVDSGS